MTIAAPPRINFPIFTTPLIGRDADVATITTHLRRSTHRFATLVGTSGTGKTRLSMQIASARETDFPDGMAFVPLASITDPALVVPTIARTLGLVESSSSTFLASLSSHIGNQAMLLVLDNFEQVVDAAPMVAELLSHIPNTHVLCTSQVPMQLADEEVIQIPPLALPDNTDSLEALEASPAVALFVERIRHVQPQFALTKRNALAVSELCRRLHGLPLAIELVATHSERLQPEDLLLLLRAYLPQERNRRDALSPEEVIFPVLSWCVSYGPPSIRWLLPRLGVLWGEWSKEQGLGLMFDPPSEISPSATLQLMVNKGLLLSMETQTNEPTFTMLDAIRQFAVRRLQTDARLTQMVSMRHAEVFAEQMQAIDTGFRSGNANHFGPIFTAAMPNIRAALQWFLAHQRYSDATGMVSHLAFASYQKGYLREALKWVDRTAPYIDQVPPESQMTWYYAQELIATMLSQYDRAIQSADLGIPIAQQLGDSTYLLRLLNNKALAYQLQGMNQEALAIFEDTLNLPQLPLMRATTLNNLGLIALDMGDFDTAVDYHQQSLAIRQEMHEEFGIGMSLHNLGDVYKRKQEYSEAERTFRESVEALQAFSKSVAYSGSVANVGFVMLKQQPDHPPPEAQRMMLEAIRTFWEIGTQREIAMGLALYVEWLFAKQQFDEAAQLLGAVLQIQNTIKIVPTAGELQELAQFRSIIDAAIGEEQRRHAEQRGAAYSLAELIDLVETW